MPLIPLMMAAALLKGVIALVFMFGMISPETTTYIILNIMGDSIFYFLPIFLAYTTADSIGTNPFTAMMIAVVLLHPDLTGLLNEGIPISFMGLPMLPATYRSSIIPVILMVMLQKPIELWLNKKLPELIKGFMVPLILLVFLGGITLVVLGPAGAFVGDVLAAGYDNVYGYSPMVAGGLLGAAIQPMVVFGFHWSFLLIAMNNVALYGSDTLMALLGPSVFAQVGSVLMVMMKTKDTKLKSICISAAISAAFGITEPAMFGVNIPLKKPMIGVCVGGGIGGVIVGLSNVHAMAFVLPSIASLPVFATEGFGLYLIGCLVGGVVALITTGLLLKKDEAMLPINEEAQQE